MAKVIAEIAVCQDCLNHIANGEVSWEWALEVEKEDADMLIESMYTQLFKREGKGHVVAACTEPEMRRYCCDLCRHYDGEDYPDSQQDKPLLGEYHHASILST